MMSTRLRLAIGSIVGLLALSASGPHAGAVGAGSPVRLDLTASAHPRSAFTPDNDFAYRVDAVAGVPVHAAATATASATCQGCSGAAISVQVLYLDRPPVAKLDNAAIAWTQACEACRAFAVSVQVVRVRHAAYLEPANRALAVTAACTRCRVTAAAYQLVVAGSGDSRLSGSTLRALDAWASDQACRLRAASRAGTSARNMRVVQSRSLGRIAHRVNAELGTVTIATRARLGTGSNK